MRTVWMLVFGAVAVVTTVFVVISGPSLAVAATVVCLVGWWLVPRSLAVPLAAAIVIGLMLVFPVQYLSEYGALSRAVLLAAPTVTALGLFRGGRSPRTNSKKILISAATFAAVLTISTLAHVRIADLSLLWATLVPALCVALLLAAASERGIRFVEQSVVVLACAESIYAIAETSLRFAPLWTAAATGRESQILPGLIRAQGTLGHPLPLALLLVTAISLLLSRRHINPLPVTVVGILLLLGGLIATGSRSALAIVAILLAVSVGRRVWSIATIAGIAGSVSVAALAAGGFFGSATWVNFVEGDSLSHRDGALAAVPRLVTDQDFASIVLGNGYFSAPSLFARGLLQQGSFFAIDNQFVTTLVEAGFVGVIALITLCVVLWMTESRYRILVFATVAFFLSFDLLSWPSAATLFTMTIMFVASQEDPNRANLPKTRSREGAGSPPPREIAMTPSAR